MCEVASTVVTVCHRNSDQNSSRCVAIHGTRTINQRVPRLEGALVDFSSGDFVVVTMYASCAYSHRSTLPSEVMTKNPWSTSCSTNQPLVAVCPHTILDRRLFHNSLPFAGSKTATSPHRLEHTRHFLLSSTPCSGMCHVVSQHQDPPL